MGCGSGAGVRRTTTETLFGVQEVSSAYLDKPLYNDMSGGFNDCCKARGAWKDTKAFIVDLVRVVNYVAVTCDWISLSIFYSIDPANNYIQALHV